jgi:glycosyltransferase involved in cell wall biosynthesis
MSAYACEPGQGSEQGVGWSVAREMAKYHDVWVITRANNRASIERALRDRPAPQLCFVYFDFPSWSRWWKRGQRGLQVYYYLWQVGAYFLARRFHRTVGFDVVHHVTFGKYWAPSFLALLPIPFVWGPVGGAESAPRAFWVNLGLRGKSHETARALARWFGERDPFVVLTARRSALALAKTEETARRLRLLGARDVRIFFEAGLPAAEIDRLARSASSNGGPVRFVGVGNLLHLKGFHLGLCAFAQAGIKNAEYWIIGDGPEREHLKAAAHDLGIAERVRFWGWLPRAEALQRVAECHALVHPSLHDSGGWVCMEAMAAGRPVICLDLGGPAAQVTGHTGLKVLAHDPQQAVRDLAEAMRRLAGAPGLRALLGEAGKRRSREVFCWEPKGALLNAMYAQACHTAKEAPHS